jgi:hypothetical protein
MSDLKWTRKTTRKISSELGRLGIRASPNTVARLLTKLNYRLRSNEKRISTSSPADRDSQFRRISRLRKKFEAAGHAIASIDTKKKELVGRFKNNGREWALKRRPVLDHDFRSDAIGMAIPYGIYVPVPNRGMVIVGRSHDTPEFAVDCVESWWRLDGHRHFSRLDHLLLLADSGGSNGARCRAWKYFLQHRLANPHQLTITVAHYPSGASKWNPIEHRLFSEISKNWAGVPLESYEAVAKYISTTTTSTGLQVRCDLSVQAYKTGIKITDAQMQQLSIVYGRTLPRWNYTIKPQLERSAIAPSN